ncbi:ammonium transporter [Haliangium ochraceum]|uniref:Ammonium transporter n=1 Tax=Haliangium ochraceum (strain DSM 14365 / JCM 11303 / SMP-2) TaxID=502025 RepID=D0LTW3_HALO1|nr:ammonium transporter [Haliangium ochraceum]ACY15807.1 ammonium transporter [Haliangium ochraceum DSM 14365]
MEPNVMVNTLWVLLSGFLVFFMNAGFALVESGLCRSKNTVNILAKNFIVFGLAVIGYWSVGYAWMFGEGSALMGAEGYFLEGLSMDAGGGLHLYAMFFFQLCFAVTAATIVSGAVAERIKIQSFMLFSLVLTAVIYPVVGHWAWGPDGWLGASGFADFAGSTVVHSVGGWAALVGAILLGPRLGKYDKAGRPRPIPGHNLAMVTLGGLILWLGWFGFNGGTELAISDAVPGIITATALAASFGTVVATMWSWLRVGKPDLTLIVNGMLGGLVGITAGCNVVPLWAAAIIGSLCGVLVIESVMFIDRRGIDDPVGAISVHLVCGVAGTLLTGVFMKESGLVFSGSFEQLKVQAIGVLAVGAFVVLVSFVGWKIVDAVLGIRVTPEEESAGLDLSEHGMEAYAMAAEHRD